MTDTPRRACKHCPCAASPSDYRCPHCRKRRPCPAKTAVPTGTAGGGKGTVPAAPHQAVASGAASAFNPCPEGAPASWPAWSVFYLVGVATIGGRTKPAYDAGVKPRDVRALRAANAEFEEAEQDAVDYFADTLAMGLADSKTPIGRIARLKSIRPAEYETALIVQNVTNNNLNLGAAPPDVDATLAKMRDMHADEWRAMDGEVIEAAESVDMRAFPPPAA